MKEIHHLYIHFPFCKSKCSYCAFYSIAMVGNQTQELYSSYIKSLTAELSFYQSQYDLSNLSTIYVGGGTPSLYDFFILDLKNIFDKLHIPIKNGVEFTIECNIDDINDKFINNCLTTGINRFSIGVQCFNKNALQQFNRRCDHINDIFQILHKFDDFKNKFEFELSLDLINNLCLNEQQIYDEIDKLEKIIGEFCINHLSVYELSIDQCSLLSVDKSLNQKCKNENLTLLYDNLLKKILEQNGFVQYEVSNFAKNGKVSKHNLSYWYYEDYLGVGPAAHSTIGNMRVENAPNVYKYITDFKSIKNQYQLTKSEQIEEFLLMKLRLLRESDMLTSQEFFDRFKLDLSKCFSKSLVKFTRNGFLYCHYCEEKLVGINVTKTGIEYLNEILTDFFCELDDVDF